MSMEEKCIEYLLDTLWNWSNVKIRVVPSVMYQVLCRKKKADENMEYRFHWFMDCSETYVHNHQNIFDTFCLEGAYTENLWEIVDDGNDEVTYRFTRSSGNKIDPGVRVKGVLKKIDTRHHFPRNILHVDINQYHSISPAVQENHHVLTFVARQIDLSTSKRTYILSRSRTIEAPIDDIREAILEERAIVHDKLQQVLRRIISRLCHK